MDITALKIIRQSWLVSTLSTVFSCYISVLSFFHVIWKLWVEIWACQWSTSQLCKNEFDLPWLVGLWFGFLGSQIAFMHFLGRTVFFFWVLDLCTQLFQILGTRSPQIRSPPNATLIQKILFQNFRTCQSKWRNTFLQHWHAWSPSNIWENGITSTE